MSEPLLILVKGLPGSGKSTVATALAQALRCPLVDKDDSRDCFQRVAGQAPDVDWNALAYAIMFRTAERQLALGLSVVLDCPFSRRQLYDEACEVARKAAGSGRSPRSEGAGIHVVLVDVECGDEAEWRRRLEVRGARDRGTERAHKPCGWDELQALLHRYDGSWRWSLDGSTPVRHHVRVCTASESTEGCVRLIMCYLQEMQQGHDDEPKDEAGGVGGDLPFDALNPPPGAAALR